MATPSASTAGGVSRGCGPIAPQSASFVSATTGWLFGRSGASTVLCQTRDGARHWSGVPAPAGAVTQIVFADWRDGWAFGPELWATHDGGAHWHRIGTSGAAVTELAAGAGRAIAVFIRDDATTFTVYTSSAGSDRWRPIPGAVGVVVAGTGEVAITLAGTTGYAISSATPAPTAMAAALTGPADGLAPWQYLHLPCPGIWRTRLAGASGTTATGTRLVLACAGVGFHPTPARVYQSADGGRSWRRLASLILQDSISTVSVASGGRTMLLTGLYSGVLVSLDGGRSWHPVAVLDNTVAVGGGDEVSAMMVTDRFGFAIVGGAALWLTRDGGRSWTAATTG